IQLLTFADVLLRYGVQKRCASPLSRNLKVQVSRWYSVSRAVAQLGRAPRSGRGGREVEYRRPDHSVFSSGIAPARFERSSTATRGARKSAGTSQMAEPDGEKGVGIISPARPFRFFKWYWRSGEVRTQFDCDARSAKE